MARHFDHGYSGSARQVHRAGVVADENTATLEQRTHLAEGEPPSQAHRTITTSVRHLLAGGGIFRSAHHDHRSAQFLSNFPGDGLKAVDRPASALGAGSYADGDKGRLNACGLEGCIDHPLVLRSRVQLEPDIPIEGAQPVLAEAVFARKLSQFQAALETAMPACPPADSLSGG